MVAGHFASRKEKRKMMMKYSSLSIVALIAVGIFITPIYAEATDLKLAVQLRHSRAVHLSSVLAGCFHLDIEEIRNLNHDRTLLYFVSAPEFVIYNVEITPRSVCISQQEIATDYVAIIVPLEK